MTGSEPLLSVSAPFSFHVNRALGQFRQQPLRDRVNLFFLAPRQSLEGRMKPAGAGGISWPIGLNGSSMPVSDMS